ncbi:MAG: hypothetical protein NTZ94_02640 [Verrucomicrobia bacterium]|nr:hypothetical protein [Verrucomicrobiota bacterium]
MAHYPLFAQVGQDAFQDYHNRYTKRITWVVAPLMLTEISTAACLLLIADCREPWFLASLAPLAFIWLSTWRVQIPLHEKLAKGFDPSAHQRLVVTNWWRTTAWTLRGFCLIMAGNS